MEADPTLPIAFVAGLVSFPGPVRIGWTPCIGTTMVLASRALITDQLFRLSAWMQTSFMNLGLDFWNAF